MFPDANTIWSIVLNGVTKADIQSYIDDYGLTPEAPTDPKVIADLTTAKAAAAAKGDSSFEAILGKVLTYGDKVLAILSKNGIIKNQNLTAQGYNIDLTTIPTDTTSKAPDATSRVFNIDFTDPKVLIITFLIIMIIAYFLFFNRPKSHASNR